MPKGPRKPGEPRLMSTGDACEALGVLQQNLRTLAGLPEPYDKVRATTLYRAEEIEALAEEVKDRRRRRREREAAKA